MGQFLHQLAMTLFLIAGGHLFLIGTLAASYTAIGPAGAHFHGNLTQAMGGEARVASSPTGTEFTICLPLPASENQLDALHAFTRS